MFFDELNILLPDSRTKGNTDCSNSMVYVKDPEILKFNLNYQKDQPFLNIMKGVDILTNLNEEECAVTSCVMKDYFCVGPNLNENIRIDNKSPFLVSVNQNVELGYSLKGCILCSNGQQEIVKKIDVSQLTAKVSYIDPSIKG